MKQYVEGGRRRKEEGERKEELGGCCKRSRVTSLVGGIAGSMAGESRIWGAN